MNYGVLCIYALIVSYYIGDVCTASDVVDGNSTAIIALLRQAAAAWLLQRMSMDTLKEVSSILLDWLRSLIEGNNVTVTTFSDKSLLSGNALLAILNYFDSYECPFRPSDSVYYVLFSFCSQTPQSYIFTYFCVCFFNCPYSSSLFNRHVTIWNVSLKTPNGSIPSLVC